MKELKEFCIPFSSLKPGSNFFKNKIDKTFFEAFNYSNPHDCNMDVSIDFRKETHLMDVRISYKGVTNIPCDRCLENIVLPVNGSFSSIIKFEHIDDQEFKEGVIYLPYETYEFNLATIIYEDYLLNFPKRNIHKEGKCDSEQLKLVRKHTQNHINNSDPRWEALKVLKNKKN